MCVSPWYDVSHTFMNSVWPWPLTSISKLYFHHGFESGKMSLLFDLGIPNFGIWVYHHETILTLVWPWLWPICGWQGFYSKFLSCFTLASKKLGCIVLARPVIPSSTKIFFIFFWELLMTATWCFLQPQLGVLHCPYRFHTCLASASFLPLYSKDLSNWKWIWALE